MPNLSNNGLSGLFIDGKSVKRASLDGKVFFEKHDYDLSVTSDKSILSYYDQDSCTITASLTDWGEPLEGETVVFSCDSALYSQQVTIWGAKVVPDFRLSNITDATNQVIFIYGDNDNSIWMNNHSLMLKNNGISTHIGYMDLSLGIQVEGDTLTYFDSSNNECTVDISMIDKENRLLTVTTSALLELYQISAVTDVNGECSVSYESKGAGDLNIQVEVPRIFLQETYELQDTFFYTTQEYNNSMGQFTSNISTNFKASFKMKYGSDGVGAYLHIGEQDKGVLIGHYGLNRLRIFNWNQGSGYEQILPSLSQNNWYTVDVTYEDGTWTVECNNQSMTWSNTYTTRTYIGYRTEAQGYIKDIIIETL